MRYLENEAMSKVRRGICRAQDDGVVKSDRARRLGGNGRPRREVAAPARSPLSWFKPPRGVSVRCGFADGDEVDQRGGRRQTKTRMDGGEGSTSPDAPSLVLQVPGSEARASGLCIGERPV